MKCKWCGHPLRKTPKNSQRCSRFDYDYLHTDGDRDVCFRESFKTKVKCWCGCRKPEPKEAEKK